MMCLTIPPLCHHVPLILYLPSTAATMSHEPQPHVPAPSSCPGLVAVTRPGPRYVPMLSLLSPQVELATGQFPYQNCKTDFEVLTKVLQEDPPLLPPAMGFSGDFQAFVRDWWVTPATAPPRGGPGYLLVLTNTHLSCLSRSLTKDHRKRPKYNKLLVSVCDCVPIPGMSLSLLSPGREATAGRAQGGVTALA